MKLLLDTHVLLWWLGGSKLIAGEALTAIEHAESIAVSAASVWEVEIKRAAGRLKVPPGLRAEVEAAGFSELPITALHAERAAGLPMIHRDPFDRVLIAQALTEGLVLATSDREILRYQVATLPVMTDPPG